MCTALSFQTKDHYFGRNLDLDCSYGEEVCVVPRNYLLRFRKVGEVKTHYAIMGMATVVSGEPLFYDAVNEHGLCMAGLNFPNNAYYTSYAENKQNIAPFELIPWILAQCKRVEEVKRLFFNLNLINIPFGERLPLSPLHWMISDKCSSITVEATKDGIHVYDNPVGVLTNNPPFEQQLFNLNNYRNLKADNGENSFLNGVKLEEYCQGLGAIGLPGDVSSMSRFVRATFCKNHSVCNEDENSSVSQFFHLLTAVEMVRGCCRIHEGKYDTTVYSACMNTDRGLYYYTTYDNRQISCVDMHKCDLEGSTVVRFPLNLEGKIYYQN